MTSFALACRPTDIGLDEKHHNFTCQLAATDYISFTAMECKTPSVTVADNIMTVYLRYRELNNRAIHKIGPIRGPSPHGGDPLSNSIPEDMVYLVARFDEACII